MTKDIDWSEWILEKNAAAEIEELKKSDSLQLDKLQKSAKNNALHRLFRDLAPHVNAASLSNVAENQGMLEHSTQPHGEGLVGFDVRYDPSKEDKVNEILENHGHFRHAKAFAEQVGDDSQGHLYGAIQLHPDRAKNLIENAPVSAEVKPGAIQPVQELGIGSQNLYEGYSLTGEGEVRGAKWQGSDPRQADDEKTHTRAGQKLSIKSQYDPQQAATTGVSERGYSRVETGKPIKRQ